MCQMSWYNTNLVDIQLSGLFFSYRIQNENKNTSEGHESENNTEPNLSEIRTIYKRISTGQINCKQNTNTDVKKSNTVHKILLYTFNSLLYTIIIFC